MSSFPEESGGWWNRLLPRSESDKQTIDLKKGGMIWLEGTAVPGGMMIRAVLPPKILRELR